MAQETLGPDANYRRVRNAVLRYGIDTSHFTTERRPGVRRPLDFYLKEGTEKNGSLRRRILASGFLGKKCVECDTGMEWCGKPLVLEINHINGVESDYRRENLRLLCPNCMSQLETYRSKNRSRG